MEDLAQASEAGFFDIDRGVIIVGYELDEMLIVNFVDRKYLTRLDEFVEFI